MSRHVLFLLGLYSICTFIEACARVKGKVILLPKRPFWLQSKNKIVLGISEGQLLVICCVYNTDVAIPFDLTLNCLI